MTRAPRAASPGERGDAAVDDSESLYERFFQDAPDAVVVVDTNGVIIDANREAATLFGYPSGELLGERVEALLPERFQQAHRDLRASYMTNPARRPMGANLDLEARRRDGSQFPVNVSLSPAATDRGPVVLAAVRDVTDRRAAEDQARQWAEVFERAEWGVVLSSADGKRLERMNPAFARMHGYRVEELTGHSMLDVFAPEVRDELAGQLEVVERIGHHTFESVHLRRDGSRFPVQIDVTAIKDDAGTLRYRAAHVTDISDRKRIEHAVRESESRFRRVFEDAPFGIALVDEELRIIQANDALSTMLAYDAEALRGMTLGDLTPEEDVRRVDQLARRLFAGELERFTIEKRLVTSRGRVVWTELSVSPLEDQAPVRGVLMAVDVTSRKQLEAELTHRATHDPLTGLPNRTLLEDRLHLAQARAARIDQLFGVLFIDLDGFKAVNDRFGHARGDLVLVEIARRIAEAVRPADTVARIGGDEFVVLCEDIGTSPERAREVAAEVGSRVLRALETAIDMHGATMTITAAIGILVTHDTSSSASALLASADAAMYAAKATPDTTMSFAVDDGGVPLANR